MLALGPLRASVALRRAAKRAETVDEIVDAVFAVPYGNPPIAPFQQRSEIVSFIELLRQEEPRRVLEIGTAFGGTLYLLAWASAPDACVLSLDRRDDLRRRRRLYRSFARERQEVQVMQCDSHSEETRDAVRAFFGDEPLDVLFIDGDHRYEGVRRDFELYRGLVRPGGLIAFHDIVDGRESQVGDVPRFWRELKASFAERLELVESWEQGGWGIGVVRVS